MYIFWAFFLLVFSLFFIILSFKLLLLKNFFIFESSFFILSLGEFKFFLLFDWVSTLFSGVVLFISSMVVFYSSSYMEDDKGNQKFLYLVLMFVLSMIFMVLGSNMIMILLGWDGLGLVSYCLVIFYQNESSSSAGMLTVLTNRLGDVGILMGIVFFISFYSWGFFEMCYIKEVFNMVVAMVMIGALTKSAQVPFSAWLPAAMAAPTPVSSLVHSSTLVTAGVYLIIRFSMFFCSGIYSEYLMFASIVTMFLSGAGALVEMDLKKIIALSTLSQLGVMMMILSIGLWELAFFHLLTHALFKAMLFLCAGIVIHGMGGSQDIRNMGHLFSVSPFISMMMMLSSMSLSGFFFLSGFYSKDMILEFMYMMNGSYFIIMFIFLATMFTVMYSLRVSYYVLWGSYTGQSEQGYYETFIMCMPVGIMGCLVVFMGSLLSWSMFSEPVFIFLSFYMKILNFFLVFLGVYFVWIQFFLEMNSGVMGEYLSSFLNSLGFLSKVSSGMCFPFLDKMVFYYKQDQKWMEEFGAQGLFSMFLSYLNFLKLDVNLTKMILIFISLVFLLSI